MESMSQTRPQDAAPIGWNSKGNPALPGEPRRGVQAGNVDGVDTVQIRNNMLPPGVLGSKPCTVICPACQQTVRTKVMQESTSDTSSTSFLAALCAICGVCLCFWLAGFKDMECCADCCECCAACCECCGDSQRAKHHYCPNCKAFIGSYTR